MLDYTHNAITELETALGLGKHSTVAAKAATKSVRKRTRVE
jgi:hypothetical protein